MLYRAYMSITSAGKAVHLDKTRAEQYAEKWHGFIVPLLGQEVSYEQYLENVALTIPKGKDDAAAQV